MGFRSGLRAVIGRISRSIGSDAAVDHPSDGGITGESSPQRETDADGTAEGSTQT